MRNDPELSPAQLQKLVPVCAIGASAGGIPALQVLFRELPTDLGLAYVVIVHLAPDHPSALAEILGSWTTMPVVQVDDNPTLRADCVYVISPDRELVIEGDHIVTRPFEDPRGRRSPINMFFRSLAAGRGDGIAVVLSGAGVDGASGVRAVKEAGGVVMVQDPEEAGFASMPQNAIASGVADFVAPMTRLSERIAEVARSKEAVRSLDMDGSANDLRRIIAFLRARTGHDFASYKRATVMRRVLRRMQVCRTDSLAAYAEYLLSTPEETQELLADLLISVTMFFRDVQAFDVLAQKAIKPLLEDPVEGDGLRIWVVGCASGEEAYSLAILIHEEAARQKLQPKVQIFASDLDDGALATAREGRYPRSIEADVSQERLAAFFTDEGTHYRVRKEVRETVLFSKHSVIKDPPFMRLDLIACRNLLIYLERSMQQQLHSIFHYCLKPERYLFLGSAETADSATELFTPLDRDARLYCARPHVAQPLPVMPFGMPERLVTPIVAATRADDLNRSTALHVTALEGGAPPSALVDDMQNILHLSASAGRFILHSAGPLSNTLPAVVRPELRLDLRLALSRALDQKLPTLTHPTIVGFDGERRRVAVQVTPVMAEAHMGAQALVFFLDGGAVTEGEPDIGPEAGPDEVRRLHSELKLGQEALLASRSGHEVAIQDLRASNEELQSINEEYRSTAEELETSKEELQSINEELHTVNAELKSKLTSISVAHSDLQNLTAATDVGTLFLDTDLRIRMFTPPIADLFNITRADVGRVISHFRHNLDYDALESDAQQVLRNLTPLEREVRSRAERWYIVRLRPYRTIEDRIDGTVVTFVDMTERRQTEQALRESEEKYRALFESMDEAYAVVEVIKDASGAWSDFRFLQANPAFMKHTNMPYPVGRTATELLGSPNPRWAQLYGQALDTGVALRVQEAEPTLGKVFDLNIFSFDPERNRVAVLFSDITDRSRHEMALQKSQAILAGQREALETALKGGPLEHSLGVLGRTAIKLFDQSVRFAFYLANAEGTTLHHIVGMPADYAAEVEGFGAGVESLATHTGEPVLTPDVMEDPLWAPWREMAARHGYRGCWSFPIHSPDGTYIATFVLYWREPRAATEEDVGLASLIAQSAAVIIARDMDRALRKTAEAHLRGSEERFQQFARASSAGLWIREADTLDMEYVSPAIAQIYGVAGDTLLGDVRKWMDVILPEDRDTALEHLRKAEAGEFVGHEFRIRRPSDGAVRWIRNTDFPLRDNGHIPRLGGIAEDITDGKDAENALRASEARFREFARSSSDVLWIRNAATWEFEYVSPAVQTIFGVSPEAVIADPRLLNALIVPEERERVSANVERVSSGGVIVQEYRIQRPSDLAFRWIRSTGFPLAESDSRVQRIGAIAHDITDEKLAGEHSAILLAELQHRVRNIMAIVRSIVARTADRAETVEEYLSLAMGRLLAFARVQALLTRAANVSVGVRSIVQDEVSVQAQHHSQYEIEGPDIVISPKAAEILTLAVHELTTNAVKYGALSVPEGKVKVRWTTLDKDGGVWLSLDWSEEGAPTHARAASGPRRRGFGSELIEGRIPYELHGRGKVTIERGGARCHLEFPLTDGASVLETGAPHRTTIFGGEADMTGDTDLSGHSVLVIEDDYYQATDTVRALRGAGAVVIGPCSTTEEAEAELGRMRPDAVLLDINLGSGPSFKLAERLKDKGIPFIFTTGYDRDIIPTEFENVTRLEKPMQLRQVVAAVTQLLTPVSEDDRPGPTS